MENSLKQRIIGAVVLAALAIIFLPAILKEKTSNGIFESQIPEKPKELKTYRVDTQKVDLQIKESQSKRAALEETSVDKGIASAKGNENQSEEQVLVETSEVVEEQKPMVETDPNTELASNKNETISDKYIDAAWVVQVASFANESNAVSMVDKLKSANYKAYRRKVSADKRVVFRVFVGPYIEKHKAQGALTEISKLSQSEAVIRPFDPIKH